MMTLEKGCIHTVEARHASEIRAGIRRQRNAGDTLPSSGYVRGGGLAAAGAGNISNPPAAVVAALNLIYAGEDNTTHTFFNGTSEVTVNATTLSNIEVIGDARRAPPPPPWR